MQSSPPLLVMDYAGPALAAVIFVLGKSLVTEPTRRTLNAILVAGASGVYLSGGFGLWELLYPAMTTPVVYWVFGPTGSSGSPGSSIPAGTSCMTSGATRSGLSCPPRRSDA
jgi:hypothetical protein